MNALLEPITAIPMPTVPTQKDHSTAPVIRDTLETESLVLVCCSHRLKEFMFELFMLANDN